jgi:outer membrane protein assembly factor BamD (BamD/ComL family)
MLNLISENQLLSEQAKTVAYREKDREALRRAIQEDLAKKDWEGALVLVDEMDQRFGYKQESERIRQEINQRFDEHIRRQVRQTRDVIDAYMQNQQWAAAHREADRLVTQFPTYEDVLKLKSSIEARRQSYKEQLVTNYHDLVAKKDLDGAIATVRQLDFYLTPEEGLTIQDSVRGIFREKQAQLRDTFTNQVHKGEWLAAYRTGEVIVRDWPNTQMAKEVRDKLESLKQRASEAGSPVAV